MADGIPIYDEVWLGNTIEPKTLESTISLLKDHFRTNMWYSSQTGQSENLGRWIS